MRVFTGRAALLLVTALAVGCGEQKTPTGLSSVEFGGAISFSRAPVVFALPFFDLPFPNPCIGAVEGFSGVRTFTLHEFVFGDPVRHHFNLEIRIDLESTSGFSGFGVASFVDNGTPEPLAPDEEFSFSVVENFTMTNDSKQQLKFHILEQLVIRNGVVARVDIVSFTVVCVGKPAA